MRAAWRAPTISGKLCHLTGIGMGLTVDDTNAAVRPRRRLLAVIGLLLPVVFFAGAATWFVRSYILPPTVNFAERSMVFPAQASPLTGSSAAHAQETTGAAGSAPAHQPAISNWPPVRQPSAQQSSPVWGSVPLPTQPRAATEPVSNPVQMLVPMPPPRPQITAANTGGPVPLPRPRPN